MLINKKRTSSQPNGCSEVNYLTFNLFDKTGLVRHAFSTVAGGISNDCFSSMNLWLGSCNKSRASKRDLIENVKKNFIIFSEAVGFDINNTVFSDQLHGTEISHVTASDRGKGLIIQSDIKNADGLATEDKNVVLTTFYADCVPLFFLDPAKKVIALSHAGWKGTLNGMAYATVKAMNERYNSNPSDILCGIGPAIGECCFEVDENIAGAFVKNLPDCSQYIKSSPVNEKYYIDLKQINKLILINSGLNGQNIEISDLCTKCNPDLFYSHRRVGVDRGQMAAVLELI